MLEYLTSCSKYLLLHKCRHTFIKSTIKLIKLLNWSFLLRKLPGSWHWEFLRLERKSSGLWSWCRRTSRPSCELGKHGGLYTFCLFKAEFLYQSGRFLEFTGFSSVISLFHLSICGRKDWGRYCTVALTFRVPTPVFWLFQGLRDCQTGWPCLASSSTEDFLDPEEETRLSFSCKKPGIQSLSAQLSPQPSLPMDQP